MRQRDDVVEEALVALRQGFAVPACFAIGIAFRVDEAAPGPPSPPARSAAAPRTSPPVTTVGPPSDRAGSDWPVFGYDAARTNVDLVREGKLPEEEVRHALDEASVELDSLTSLVSDLVELARGEERKLRLEDVALDDLVSAARR